MDLYEKILLCIREGIDGDPSNTGYNDAIDDVLSLFRREDAIKKAATTVYELAEHSYPGVTFDSALPQDWVNAMENRGFDVRSHFVTLYPKDSLAYMAPITPQGIRMSSIIASYL